MEKSLTGLVMGLSFTIISFLASLALFLICFYVLDFRLHSWGGTPYMDVIIYYQYIIIVLGFIFSIMVAKYINVKYPQDLIKNALLISLVYSIVFVISSWFIVEAYRNSNFTFYKIFPPITERYNLAGYHVPLSYFVIIGFYLIITPLLIVLIRGSFWKNKSKKYQTLQFILGLYNLYRPNKPKK